MLNNENIAIEAATDGACSGNPGAGGWGGLILFEDGSRLEIGGGEKHTTNNRMELTAAIKTLEKLKDFKLKNNFKLRTDSKYVIEGYTNWIKKWKNNGWKTSAGKPVQNEDLWKKIDELRLNGLSMEFVKGHSGDLLNERVDLIATNYSKGIPLRRDSQDSKVIKNKNEEIAPSNIKKLFSRIDLVSSFEDKGYLLNSNELSDLLSLNNEKNLQAREKFDWRNWSIIPIEKNYWKIIKKNVK
ncbi:MAG: ribonuclease HI [Prochlorococcus sp. SP3034]|nr:ribonuclease HI [Prochlorococcus sp. SP3034]|tara:strand:- start:4028 stop:4753 length:726 start_codon:yes stop_codon:yes gene_type:complete